MAKATSTSTKQTTAGKKNADPTGIIRSMNIPREVRDGLQQEAKARGISASALGRVIMDEYVAGTLVVPDAPGPQIVSTSVWVPRDLWARFAKKSEKNGHSSQWIFRTWLDREQSAE
jgi:hypothetical protein